MGRDLHYCIIKGESVAPNRHEYDSECRFQNCIDYMYERDFSRNELEEYTMECFYSKEFKAVEALAYILKLMDEDDYVWICS